MCLIVGCSRKSGRDKGIRLYRVPAVVTNQGPEVEELSTDERRRRWISAISCYDLTEKILNNDRVCDQHFHFGTAALLWDRYNIDWVPTLNLGHDKLATQREQNQAQEARAERSKERRKRQAELQEQERLLKQQKLNEFGLLLPDFAPGIESLSTPDTEQVQGETVDLQPLEQETHHDCSTQTKAFDHLYRSVASLSVRDCPRTDASTQTEEFDYLFTQSSTSKPFDQNYFRDDNAKVSFYTGVPTHEVLEATFNHVSPFVKRLRQCLTLFQEMIMSLNIKTKCSTPRLGL